MSAAQPRQPRGIPTGGRYAADVRAEPEVALAPPAPPARTAAQLAIRSYDTRIRQLLTERDGAHIQAAVECVRRDFPTAVEIRVRNNIDPNGQHREGMIATGLRDAEGNDPAAGDPGWAYRGAETGYCLSTHLLAYENNHRPSGEAFTWDDHTEEWVLPVRDYWKPGS